MDAVLAPKLKNSRITEQDARSMAELISKRITETGACLILGLKPETWFKWKIRAKHSGSFEKVLTHAREAKLNAILETIDSAGDPYEVVTKSGASFMRPGDWRAKAWLAERVLAPERLGDRQQPANQTNVLIGDDMAAKVIALFSKQKQLNQPQSTTKQVGNEKNLDSTGDSQ